MTMISKESEALYLQEQICFGRDAFDQPSLSPLGDPQRDLRN